MGIDEDASGAWLSAYWNDRTVLLVACAGSYFAVRFAQVLLGPVVPWLIETFPAASRGTIGMALTGMWVAYALVQLPSGVLADRAGERHAVLAALVITAGTTIGLATAPTFPLFVVGVIALGVGAGTYYNPATALLAREFGEMGGAIGTHRIGSKLAGVVAPVTVASVTVWYGWRLTIATGAALAAVAAVLFARAQSPTPPLRPDASLRDLFDPAALLELLGRPHTRTTTVMMVIVEFVGLAVMAFLPTLLIEHFAFSTGRANLVFAGFFAVSALFQPIAGRLSDRIGRDATVGMLMVAGVLGYGTLAAGGARVLALPAVFLAGVATSSTPVIQSRMIDGLGEANRGRGFGLFRTLYLLVGATGTTVVGVTADAVGWTAAFGLLAALLAVVLGVTAGFTGAGARTQPGE